MMQKRIGPLPRSSGFSWQRRKPDAAPASGKPAAAPENARPPKATPSAAA